jgi:probable rRNA maturation factor
VPERRLRLDLIDPAGLLPAADAAWLRDAGGRVLARAAEHCGAAGEIRVKIVADAEMADAHERWSGVPGTTDVLTFDLSGDPSAVDADALVCADEAARQAAGRGHSVREELLLYVLHALLHCLGHDDTDEAGYDRMHAAEDELLTAAGIGALFARADGGQP